MGVFKRGNSSDGRTGSNWSRLTRHATKSSFTGEVVQAKEVSCAHSASEQVLNRVDSVLPTSAGTNFCLGRSRQGALLYHVIFVLLPQTCPLTKPCPLQRCWRTSTHKVKFCPNGTTRHSFTQNHGRFHNRIKTRTEAWSIGDPWTETQVGAFDFRKTHAQVSRLHSGQKDGGLQPACSGVTKFTRNGLDKARCCCANGLYWLQNQKKEQPNMPQVQDEIFGPVMSGS